MREHIFERNWRQAQSRITTAWSRGRQFLLRAPGQQAPAHPPLLRDSPEQPTRSTWEEEAVGRARPAVPAPRSRDVDD